MYLYICLCVCVCVSVQALIDMFDAGDWSVPIILVNVVDISDVTTACIRAAVHNLISHTINEFSLYDRIMMMRRYREEYARKKGIAEANFNSIPVPTLHQEAVNIGLNYNEHTFRVLATMAFTTLSHTVVSFLHTIALSPKKENEFGITKDVMYSVGFTRTRDLPAVQGALMCRLYAHRRVTGKCMTAQELNTVYRVSVYAVRTVEQIEAAKKQAEEDEEAVEWTEAQKMAYKQLEEQLYEGGEHDEPLKQIITALDTDNARIHAALCGTTKSSNKSTSTPLIYLCVLSHSFIYCMCLCYIRVH